MIFSRERQEARWMERFRVAVIVRMKRASRGDAQG
jgi:hypothetical protein